MSNIHNLMAVAHELSGKPKDRGRPRGKRSNPDFEQTTLYLNQSIKREVQKALLQNKIDISDLTNMLLKQWLEQQQTFEANKR